MQQILITGVSSGIGHALASEYLSRGARVYGTSRRSPDDLTSHEAFRFVPMDLTAFDDVEAGFKRLLEGVDELDLVVCNAGILGPFGDMAEQSLADMKHVLDVNLWANKVVLDAIYRQVERVRQVVTISSGAAVNGHRGWGGYALSKAALNMLTMLYAAEQPDTHFCALAPGVVETSMQDYLNGLPEDERYPSLDSLRSKRDTSDMPSPEELAPRLVDVMHQLPERVQSGQFADIRKPPLAGANG
ncbi:Benzil reductase ((S)-benzoin forming) [Maioricimonas rarisocia]|uniref:Benzil reductase ((S)-benzoin forming) n=1 Tax=Maioricimonas rarisocia TaxID=2528026 RepID=A0A517ZDU8_9PLAN|nr:SDR family NAD(P)-dependent oxidoreductase [Maioricimonas rarisocia]QDU40619.1 Benzil reductase ((S)-benzoin forming) [Maioricimonas rarisocia]